MKSLARLLFVPTIIGLLAVGVAPVQSAEAADGKKIFTDKKCDTCHSLQTQKIEKVVKNGKKKKGPDLSGAGLNHDAESTAAWLSKKEERKSVYGDKKVKHKKKFKGSDDELKALAAFMAEQKTKVDVKDDGADDDSDDKEE